MFKRRAIQQFLLFTISALKVSGHLRNGSIAKDERKLDHIALYPQRKLINSENTDGCVTCDYGEDGVPSEGDLVILSKCNDESNQLWDVLTHKEDDGTYTFQLQMLRDDVTWCAHLGKIDDEITDPTRLRIGECYNARKERHKEFRFDEPLDGLNNAITPVESEGDFCITGKGYAQHLGTRIISKECVFVNGNGKKRYQWKFEPSVPGL